MGMQKMERTNRKKTIFLILVVHFLHAKSRSAGIQKKLPMMVKEERIVDGPVITVAGAAFQKY